MEREGIARRKALIEFARRCRKKLRGKRYYFTRFQDLEDQVSQCKLMNPSLKQGLAHKIIQYIFQHVQQIWEGFICLIILLFCRRFSQQYHRGRRTRGERWVFGIFDTQYEPSRTYLQLVRRRNAATLLPIIRRKVRPGTIVYSDQWAAYNRIQRDLGLIHETVTVYHSVNFVDPASGVHTHNNWKITGAPQIKN